MTESGHIGTSGSATASHVTRLTRNRWLSAAGSWIRTDGQVWVLALAAIAVRLILLPFAENDHADAITRVFISQEWLSNPTLIPHDIWPPVPFYLTGLALAVFRDPLFAPLVVTTVLGGLTAYPLARFVILQTGNPTVGLLAGAIYALYPLSLRLSLLSLAEVPSAFFFWVGLWLLAKYQDQGKTLAPLVAAALSLNLASASRFDMWFLLLPVALLFVRNKRHLALFLSLVAIFPLLWMIYTWAHGGLLPQPIEIVRRVLGISPTTTATVEAGALETPVQSLRQRLISYPAVLAFGLTPLVAFFSLWGLIHATLKRRAVACGVLVAVLSAALVVKSLASGIDPRYAFLATTLFVPYAALGLNKLLSSIDSRVEYGAVVGIVFTSIFAFPYLVAWSGGISANLPPVPRADPQQREIVDWLRANLKPEDYLVLDHMDGFQEHWVLYASRGNNQRTWTAPGPFGGYETYAEFPMESLVSFVRTYKPRYMVVTINGAEGRQQGRLAPALGLSFDDEETYHPDLGAYLRPLTRTRIAMIYSMSYDIR